MGFSRAKSTPGNTNCQKSIFEDDQVLGHHPRALNACSALQLKQQRFTQNIYRQSQMWRASTNLDKFLQTLSWHMEDCSEKRKFRFYTQQR